MIAKGADQVLEPWMEAVIEKISPFFPLGPDQHPLPFNTQYPFRSLDLSSFLLTFLLADPLDP